MEIEAEMRARVESWVGSGRKKKPMEFVSKIGASCVVYDDDGYENVMLLS